MKRHEIRLNSIPIVPVLLAISLALTVVIETDGTATFDFAAVGMAYSAAMFEDDPLVGKEIVSARIVLDVVVDAGSDGADFHTDLLLPIEPFEGGTSVVILNGDEMGWSGDGVFRFSEETDRFNGTFVARRYGAETYGVQGRLLATSRVELTYLGGGACMPAEAVAAVE